MSIVRRFEVFKYYRGWRALWLAVYAFILMVAVTNIVQGIGGDNSYGWNLGIAQIVAVMMFVISDLKSGIIERQDRDLRLMRGDSR